MTNEQEPAPKEANPEASPTILDFEEENEESARIDAARARRIADEGATADTAAPSDEDDGPEEAPKRQPSPRRTSFKNAREVLLEEVPLRAKSSSPILRTQLLGTISVEIEGSTERYLFDWSTDNFKALEGAAPSSATPSSKSVVPGAGAASATANTATDTLGATQGSISQGSAPQSNNPQASATPDCVIRINQTNLLKIAAGDLNPQVAMLSSKIKVSGRASLAIYFFNLVAPRQNY
jgi:hypothetical protein